MGYATAEVAELTLSHQKRAVFRTSPVRKIADWVLEGFPTGRTLARRSDID